MERSYAKAEYVVNLLRYHIGNNDGRGNYPVLDTDDNKVGIIKWKSKEGEYDISVKSADYLVDINYEARQGDKPYRIEILNGQLKGYKIEFTIVDPNEYETIVCGIKISNPDDEYLELSWCHWDQEGFKISSSSESVNLKHKDEYEHKAKYSDGSGYKYHVMANKFRNDDLLLEDKTVTVTVPEKDKAHNCALGYELLEQVVSVVKTHRVAGKTINDFIINDQVGLNLLTWFECIYSQLPFAKSLKEVIGEKRIKKTKLSLLYDQIDKEKKVSVEEKIKILKGIQ